MNTSDRMTMTRHNLTVHVTQLANNLSKTLGIGFEDVEDAPDNYRALVLKFNASLQTGKPVPVYSEGSENTIYTNKHGNYAFRFWHDFLHYVNDYDFSIEGELLVADLHLKNIRDTFGFKSLEYRLIYADTIGQIYYYKRYQAFPDNQLDFALAYIESITKEITL